MTSTRDRLALILCHEENGDEGCVGVCIHPPQGSFCPYTSVVDKILDELMEPGEGAKLIGARSIGQTMSYSNHVERAKDCWQAALTAIREGK